MFKVANGEGAAQRKEPPAGLARDAPQARNRPRWRQSRPRQDFVISLAWSMETAIHTQRLHHPPHHLQSSPIIKKTCQERKTSIDNHNHVQESPRHRAGASQQSAINRCKTDNHIICS